MEAIREFNKILLYIYKTKQYHQKSPQYEQILKKNEQMYALLAISLSLCPQVKLVEETVNSQLREKYGEKMIRMQRYDDEAFAIYDELFSYACPKFITPSAPSFEEPLVNYNQVCSPIDLWKMLLCNSSKCCLLTLTTLSYIWKYGLAQANIGNVTYSESNKYKISAMYSRRKLLCSNNSY